MVSTSKKTLRKRILFRLEENWFTPNFNNAFHQLEKKVLNKRTWSEINPKSVYTICIEAFYENPTSTGKNICKSKKKRFQQTGIKLFFKN